MKKKFQTYNDEIDLIELMQTIWKGKWKIAFAVIVSCIAMIIYQPTSTPNNNFTAITKIKPISYLEINRYQDFNNLLTNINTNTNTNTITNININTNTNTNTNSNTFDNVNAGTVISVNTGMISKITRLRLLDLYLNILKNESVFENAIRKFNLLEASKYNNKQEYSEAIIRLASSVKILSPSSVKILSPSVNDETNSENSYHTIHFKYHDVEKWRSVLIYVDELANKLVKKILIDEYNDTFLFLQQERKFQLEDILVKKNNYLIDYEREVSNRIAYLKEQSAIAKKLGIAKKTIEVLTSGNQNALLSNVQTGSLFYLRGYEAIDEEIEIIKLRKDKRPFIKGLHQLEKEKRAIEQNKTIERVKLAFQSELIQSNKEFSAASIKATTTKFEYNNNNNNNREMLVIAIVIGLITGIFYVIISNAFQSQRISRKN